ncbi:MAG: hypothetical protein PHV77_05925 [Candidatus Omnitrophica bacterium]|nr:hypothetical protein [Candidatus Omnitrophota bacterium]
MAKNTIALLLAFIFILTASPSYAYVFNRDGFTDNIPQPVLLEPVIDRVDISGKKELVFRWSPHQGDISRRKFYDFRLYQGYKLTEDGLLLQKNVAPNEHQLAVDSSVFKPGQVYTWSLRQKYRSGKSRRSSSSFTIIGK